MGREKVEVIGLAHLEAKLAEAGSATRRAAEKAVAEEVQATEDDARRLAPKDTGKLRRGIRGEADGLEGGVKSTVRYADFVEHGTKHTPAQPYMTPASNLARRRLPKRAAEVIAAALEEL